MSFRETGFILANCGCVCVHCDRCISCCCIQVKERKYFVVEINVDAIIIASFFKYYSQYNENKIVLVKIVLRCLDNFEIHALFANLPLLSTCYSMRIIFCSPEKFFIWNGIFHENKWPTCTLDPYRASKVYISIILSSLCFHPSPFKNSLC